MSFCTGFVVGIMFGLALMMILKILEARRTREKHQLATATVALSRLTLNDLKKMFSKESFPQWIVFSEHHKVAWFNHHLKKFWPYLDEATSTVVKAALEPMLEHYKPAIISSLKFERFTLGTVAPQFVGVQMIDTTDEEIILEAELQWNGNPKIVLAVKTAMGVTLPIKIKDIGFSGVFRLVFKPLVKELPCFGAIMYSLHDQKKLDFRLKAVGEITSVPGLAGILDAMIRNLVTDSLAWPMRQVIPILPGDYRNLRLEPTGTLMVKLVQAKNLLNMDTIGKSDPYAIIFIRPIPKRMKKSRIINNELNPIWNEEFQFEVEDLATQKLTIRIFDEDGLYKADLLGCAQVSLKKLIPGIHKEFWLTLLKDLDNTIEQKYRGEVHLELLYKPYVDDKRYVSKSSMGSFSMTYLEKEIMQSMSQSSVQGSSFSLLPWARQHNFVRGVLSVTVLRAENLIKYDNLEADPYVMLLLKKSNQRKTSSVIYKDSNPEWNQTFRFLVEDALHDILIVEIWNYSTFRKHFMGRFVSTLSKVLLEGEYEAALKLEGVDSGQVFLHLNWILVPLQRQPFKNF